MSCPVAKQCMRTTSVKLPQSSRPILGPALFEAEGP
jgi:hypothetical protein